MKKILLLTFFCSVVFVSITNAQNEKFKALFIYNFTKYLEWPQSYNQGDFVITVLGDSPIAKELEVIAAKKKIGMQAIDVKKISSVSQLSKSHMVFVPKGKATAISKLQEKLKGTSTLVITDKQGAIKKGAEINFVVKGSKQKFEISKANIESQGIKVESSLLSLGIPK